jgi:hypothetical protein
MSERPSRLWKNMTAEQRSAAAEAFWKEDQADIQLQHMEAVVAVARRMNFRPKSVQALPLERKARMLAQMSEVSDSIATRALISYHFQVKRDLMSAFLDAVGITHDNGMIAEESVPPPPAEKLATAIKDVRTKFPPADVDLYLHTLATLDGDTWAGMDEAMAATAQP